MSLVLTAAAIGPVPSTPLPLLSESWLHHLLSNGAAATAPHGTHTAGRAASHDTHTAGRAAFGARGPIAVCCARESAPCPSMSVLTAAALGPVLGSAPVSRHHVRRCRCSQQQRLVLCWLLTPLRSESVLAMPSRPASKLQPLHCRWLHHLLWNGAAATAPHATHGRSFRSSVPWPIAVCCGP